MIKIVCFLSFFLMISVKQESDTAEQIIWSANRPLKWDDFRSKPERRSREVAVTFSGIQFSYTSNGQNIRATVVTTFNKNRSWAKKEIVNDYILIHEQKHFDITEWYARKLRRALKKIPVRSANHSTETGKLYKKMIAECNQTQERYDKETGHSRNTIKQGTWNKIIERELELLAAETDTLVTFR